MMRYPFALLLLLCLAGVAHAQSLTVELAGGPTMAYRISTTEKSLKKVVDEERPMLSYEAGVRMFYSLNENWGIGGGFIHSRKGFHSEPYQFTNEFGEPMKEAKNKFVYSFFELPLIARYVVKEKNKFRLYVQSGLSPSFCLRERILLGEPIYLNGQQFQEFNTTGDLRSVNLTLHAGVGVLYKLADRWQLGAEPAFNSHLLSMLPSGEHNYNGAIQRRLFSVGLNLVASYSW